MPSGCKLRAWKTVSTLALLVLVSIVFPLSADEPVFKQGPWPFFPPVRPVVPAVESADWVINPIDAFVLARLEAKGLSPSAAADKLTLLRRVTFDLTGLPPTVAEQQGFLADDREGAYERLVDRLLDSPRFGERAAQHWLDIVRYAETDGFKSDELRPAAHQYRDYVIRAFNADLPYDRFLGQQLAGDELEPDNPDAIVATGLNRLYPDESNAADVRQRRQEIHDNITDTTALALLGLTVGCAQCHDHKFDPITQVDYFRLQAFFATLLPRDDLATAPVDEIRRHAEQQSRWEAATAALRAERDALIEPRLAKAMGGALEKFDAEIRLAVETPAGERSCMQQQIAYQAMRYVAPKMENLGGGLKGDQKKRFEELQAELAKFDHLKPAELPRAMAVSDASGAPPQTFTLSVGDYRKPMAEVQPGFPAFLGASDVNIETTASGTSSGRRTALARWLCRPDHPLTGRVMMNRLWQQHFGVGIVATPNDFGAMGEAPTHPELLDWLAVEFVERGWSLKAMHRLMVTSAAYRQSSLVDVDDQAHATATDRDPDNQLLWHARRRRLEGEAIRDAMLALSGELQPRMFGPSARPELPRGVEGGAAWQADKRPEDQNRRSIYVFAKRNLRYPLFEIFDQPDLHNSCPQRTTTTTAPQSLALLNGDIAFERARRWAGRLLAENSGDEVALIDTAWTEAFARTPREAERQAAAAFLDQQATALASATSDDTLPIPLPSGGDPARSAALVDLCHALLNANEFLYVD